MSETNNDAGWDWKYTINLELNAYDHDVLLSTLRHSRDHSHGTLRNSLARTIAQIIGWDAAVREASYLATLRRPEGKQDSTGH